MRIPNLLLLILCITLIKQVTAQTPETPTFRLYLIGDAGENDETGFTLLDLKAKLDSNPNSAVIFLGDNCYKRMLFGIIHTERKGFDGGKITRRRMMSQLSILKDYHGYAYFIPGNHDWWNLIKLKKGKKRLLMEQKFIEDALRNYTTVKNHDKETFLPGNGTPGPVSKDFNGGKTRIIFIDTYRLIIEEGERRHEDSLYLKDFYTELKAQLADATKKREKIIVVGHHPIHAKGKHSFPMEFWERLNRRFADNNTNYPPYNRMAVHLDSLLREAHRPDLYYASGHEHSLEYFLTDSLHYIVSGAGSKVDNLLLESCQDESECLQWNEQGFFEIDFYGRKETVLLYHRKDEKSALQVLCIAGCN